MYRRVLSAVSLLLGIVVLYQREVVRQLWNLPSRQIPELELSVWLVHV